MEEILGVKFVSLINGGAADQREYFRRAPLCDVIRQTAGRCGWAAGSGNSIPSHVPAAGCLAMVNTVREHRE